MPIWNNETRSYEIGKPEPPLMVEGRHSSIFNGNQAYLLTDRQVMDLMAGSLLSRPILEIGSDKICPGHLPRPPGLSGVQTFDNKMLKKIKWIHQRYHDNIRHR